MSSKAFRTVLFPEPESPVRMTSWVPSFLDFVGVRRARFTAGGNSALHAALVRARNTHVFPVLGDSAASHVDAAIIQLLRNLLVRQRLGGVFFINHFLHQALQR